MIDRCQRTWLYRGRVQIAHIGMSLLLFTFLLVTGPAALGQPSADRYAINPYGRQATTSPDKAFAYLPKRNNRFFSPFYNSTVWPHAVEENGKVFLAYQDFKGRPIVMAYDIERRAWQGPVRADAFGIGPDTHGNPSLCIDETGRLHLFFGCHGWGDKKGPMRHVRSVEPYSISEWERMSAPVDPATYPQSWRAADGRLFLFYRAGTHMDPWQMKISRDHGQTWSKPQSLVELRRAPEDPKAAAYCYFQPGVDRQTVHAFFVHKDDNPTRVEPHPWRPLRYRGLSEAVYRYNVYYMYRNTDGVWQSERKDKLDLPLSREQADRQALVYDTGHEFGRVNRVAVGPNNQPYLRFQRGVWDWTTDNKPIVPMRTMFATLKSDHWRIQQQIPNAWPSRVRRQLKAPGYSGMPITGPWSLYYENRNLQDAAGTYLYLHHLNKGVVSRSDGPAPLPSSR
jgi:hypothetical protein